MISPVLFSLAMSLSSGAPVQWHFGAMAADDGQVLITFTALLEPGWHLYATDLPSDDGPLPTEFRFTEHGGYTVKVPLTEPDAVEEYDPNFMMVVRHHSGEPRFTMVVEPAGERAFNVVGEVEYMVCNDRTCLPPVVVPFDIAVETIEPTEER
jgi:hypothetical protein